MPILYCFLPTRLREDPELKEVTPQTPETIEVKGKQYKRNNRIIAQLKILRDFKCQICGTRILKRDKYFYVEAAHIIQKKDRGPEIPDNLIILCPNHHKEYDLGEKQIIKKTKDEVVFNLNGIKYSVSLKVE